MGKGDRRSRRGKINRGTYGKTRQKRKRKSSSRAAPRAAARQT
jgi:30S ribosomal protein S31